ncbi:MAG: DUF6659 family protein [Nitrososphaera sp.]
MAKFNSKALKEKYQGQLEREMNNDGINLTQLCEKVLTFDDDIRYAGVIDSGGALVAGGMRNGLDSLVAQTDEELFLAQTALRRSMRERFDSTMGTARFAYVEREKISILTFYMKDKILVVTLEPNVESHTAMDIAEDTLELLDGKK